MTSLRCEVEIDDSSSDICCSCDGTGCYFCGGCGEVARAPTVTFITCVCGHEYPEQQCAKAQFERCVECGHPIDEDVANALAEVADGQ